MKIQGEERASIDFRNVFGRVHREHLDALIHIANQRRVSAGHKGFATHRILRRMGFQAGVVDYFLAVPVGGFPGLWMEAKKDDGALYATQMRFLSRMRMRGYACAVGQGSGALLAIASRYLRQPATGDPVFRDVVGVLPVDIATPDLAEFRKLDELVAEKEIAVREKHAPRKRRTRKWGTASVVE